MSLFEPKEKAPSRRAKLTAQQRLDNWREVQTVIADCATRHESSKEVARYINQLAYDQDRFNLLSVEAQRLDTGAPIVRPAKRARADDARTRGTNTTKAIAVRLILEAESNR